jgi:hypothetical protein
MSLLTTLSAVATSPYARIAAAAGVGVASAYYFLRTPTRRYGVSDVVVVHVLCVLCFRCCSSRSLPPSSLQPKRSCKQQTGRFKSFFESAPSKEHAVLDAVLSTAKEGDSKAVLDTIDRCASRPSLHACTIVSLYAFLRGCCAGEWRSVLAALGFANDAPPRAPQATPHPTPQGSATATG